LSENRVNGSGCAALLACLLLSGASTAQDHYQAAMAALDRIPSIAGGSILDRMKRCRARIERSSAYVNMLPMDEANIGGKAGDLSLQVLFSIPPLPGDEKHLDPYTGLSAIWLIRGTEAIPVTGWAKTLQTTPAPIGSVVWMNC